MKVIDVFECCYEAELLKERECICDALAAELEGKAFWEKPLYEARQ